MGKRMHPRQAGISLYAQSYGRKIAEIAQRVNVVTHSAQPPAPPDRCTARAARSGGTVQDARRYAEWAAFPRYVKRVSPFR
ncbi:hypothetical protein TPA0905_18150 [Streptomyces olivaceus]|nr:hypothetical protein TPA0905_18150 [Streptomyces olivaceus]